MYHQLQLTMICSLPKIICVLLTKRFQTSTTTPLMNIEYMLESIIPSMTHANEIPFFYDQTHLVRAFKHR